MTSVSLDELGPVDYIVVEFPAGASNFTGEMVTELRALVDSGTIRVIDVLILTKDADGTVEATELSDVGELGDWRPSRRSWRNCWPPMMSTCWPLQWSREASLACSSGRTCGPRRSRRRRGVRVAS